MKKFFTRLQLLWAESITKVIFSLLLVWALGSVGIYFLENNGDFNNLANAFWWTIVTITTVGYGDMSPVGVPGRIFAIIIMFSGIGLIAIVTGSISSVFVARKIREGKGLEDITLENHIVICGWSRKMEKIINALIDLSQDTILKILLINEENSDKINAFINKYKQAKIKFLNGDFTEEAILLKANIRKAEAAIILPDYRQKNDQRTILATLGIKHLSSDCKTIVYANDKESIRYLKRANADEIIVDDDFETFMAAAHILSPGIPEVLNQILDYSSPHSFRGIHVPKEYIGKTYDEFFIHLRNKKNELCIGLFEIDKKLGVSDFLSSDSSGLDAFIERKLREAGHQLGEKNKVGVIINPDKEYVIKPNEGALVIR